MNKNKFYKNLHTLCTVVALVVLLMGLLTAGSYDSWAMALGVVVFSIATGVLAIYFDAKVDEEG